jgi:hypothetical protein
VAILCSSVDPDHDSNICEALDNRFTMESLQSHCIHAQFH